MLRVDNIAELFSMAEVLAKQPRPKGPRLTILTNAGGPGVLATDALSTAAASWPSFTPETIAAFNEILPAALEPQQPDRHPGRCRAPTATPSSLEIAAADPNSDGLLVILTPQAMTDPTETAEQLKPFGRTYGKPVIASWMGGARRGRRAVHSQPRQHSHL